MIGCDAARRPASGSFVELVDVSPVLAACTREAWRTRHAHVGTEHLALAASSGPGGFCEMAVSVGLDPGRIVDALGSCCNERRTDDGDEEPRATPRVVRMLALAAQIAVLRGERAVGPRHLVAALLSEPGCVAWRGLRAGGLDPQTVAGLVDRAGPGPVRN